MTRRQLRQSNLTGAAGLVSLDDGCITKFVQRGTKGAATRTRFLKWLDVMSSRRERRGRPKSPSAVS